MASPSDTSADIAQDVSPPLARTEQFVAELKHHALLIAITLTYCVTVVAYLTAHDMLTLPVFHENLIAAAIPISMLGLFRVFGEFAHHAVHVRPFRWSGVGRGIVQSEICSRDRWLAAIVPVALLPVFSSLFTTFKVSIPELAPFAWDQAFMELDFALHGGHHPWELLQAVLGHPLVTSAISFLYNIWMAMILIVYWQMFRIQERALRMQFLLAFVMTWIVLGSVMAFWFSSAGPCFYGYVADGPDPYAPLMDYLNGAHEQYRVWALYAQEYLWTIYSENRAHLGGGISAMPSLHLGVVALLYLLARRYNNRAMAWLAGSYVVIILIGSVHLGWHYAVDGYVGILGGWLAWLFAGWLVRRVVPPAPPPTEVMPVR